MLPPEDLIAIRTRLDLGKETMARILGVGLSSIHRWEKGDSGPTGPVLHVYRALKAALDRGVNRQQLLARASGDPGVFFAHVLSMGFLQEGHDASRGSVRGRPGTR